MAMPWSARPRQDLEEMPIGVGDEAPLPLEWMVGAAICRVARAVPIGCPSRLNTGVDRCKLRCRAEETQIDADPASVCMEPTEKVSLTHTGAPLRPGAS